MLRGAAPATGFDDGNVLAPVRIDAVLMRSNEGDPAARRETRWADPR